MHEDEIDARVVTYFRDFSDLIRSNGFGDILGVGDPAKAGYIECSGATQLGMDLPVAAEVPNGDKLPGYELKDSLAIGWLIFTGPDVSESTHRVT
ncbi:unnamed protein product [Phytophthora lilii]|uniref:Unnamed protein product n=1 Tax=Phytophthora lilii TaxID=2077276 RepID=A0A9W7DAM1_9STRA|nr:unnamed protein product [Phytophthora lilii]